MAAVRTLKRKFNPTHFRTVQRDFETGTKTSWYNCLECQTRCTKSEPCNCCK